MKIQGNEGSASEIIMIIAFVAGLILVFYVLLKNEISGFFNTAKKAISDAIPDMPNPIDELNQAVWKTESAIVYQKENLMSTPQLYQKIEDTLAEIDAPPGVIPGMGSTAKQVEASYEYQPEKKYFVLPFVGEIKI